jgi:hypothetical protein
MGDISRFEMEVGKNQEMMISATLCKLLLAELNHDL